MIGRKARSFKAIAHMASRLKSVSAKAGLGAQVVATEIPTIKPTVAIASAVVGVSPASIRKALKVSTFERELMVANVLTLAEIGEHPEPVANDNDDDTVAIEALIAAEQTPSTEPVFAHEKSLLVFGPRRMTVDDLLDVYTAMSPSEQIAFGRAIGVERVWLPRQRKR
jgi:hypothetical protein